MFRSSTLLCALVSCLMCGCAPALDTAAPRPALQSLEFQHAGEKILGWKATFDRNASHADQKAVVGMLQTVTEGSRRLTGKNPVVTHENVSIVSLGIEPGFVKSAPLLHSLQYNGNHASPDVVYVYAFSTQPPAGLEEKLSVAIATMDSALRGHRVGADDGITLTHTHTATGKTTGIVELIYSGGIYPVKK